MYRNPVVDVQTPWECRWTCMANRVPRGTRRQQAQTVIWLCLRDGTRRHVTDEDCESCECWEPEDAE